MKSTVQSHLYGDYKQAVGTLQVVGSVNTACL